MHVRFEDVTLAFDQKKVLNKINFTLPDKELISFLGPSGSGKSTTLYLISGLLEVTDGKIFFDDRDVTQLDPAKRGIGLVFQNYALYPHMSVLDNIMYPLKIAKVPKKERRKKAIEMAELTQIADHLDKFPSQLSGGQQQRVAISRALVKEPSILLMDEPLSNLDARLRIEMRQEIRRIQQETGITTVFVTHDQEEALSIADSVMVLNDGEIQQMSDPVTLYKQPNNLFVARFIGSPIMNVFDRENDGLMTGHAIYQKSWQQLGVRPEHFILGTPDDHLIYGQVQTVEYVGKDITTHVDVQGKSVLVSGLTLEEVQPGQDLYLTANEKNMVFFDTQGNRIDASALHDDQKNEGETLVLSEDAITKKTHDGRMTIEGSITQADLQAKAQAQQKKATHERNHQPRVGEADHE